MDTKFLFTDKLSVEDYLRLREEVGWKSIAPEQAQAGLDNSYAVIAAMLDGEAVGFVRLLWDGGYVAFLSDVIVVPEYQGQGIGKHLLAMVKERYSDFMRIVIVAYNDRVSFYETCGFSKGEGKSPMFIEKF